MPTGFSELQIKWITNLSKSYTIESSRFASFINANRFGPLKLKPIKPENESSNFPGNRGISFDYSGWGGLLKILPKSKGISSPELYNIGLIKALRASFQHVNDLAVITGSHVGIDELKDRKLTKAIGFQKSDPKNEIQSTGIGPSSAQFLKKFGARNLSIRSIEITQNIPGFKSILFIHKSFYDIYEKFYNFKNTIDIGNNIKASRKSADIVDLVLPDREIDLIPNKISSWKKILPVTSEMVSIYALTKRMDTKSLPHGLSILKSSLAEADSRLMPYKQKRSDSIESRPIDSKPIYKFHSRIEHLSPAKSSSPQDRVEETIVSRSNNSQPVNLDINNMTDQVCSIIERQLKIERERRGYYG
jgi:hypothetical protein